MTEVKLELFTFKGFELRAVNLEGQPYFVGKDVATMLGYAKARNAIANHVDIEDKKDAPIQGDLGGTQKMTVINESGLYSLILKSKLPEAKDFKRWVTTEVLPQIRMTGGYIPIEREDTDEEILAKAVLISQRTIKEKEAIIKQQDELLKKLEPKAEYSDNILTSKGTHTISTIAADYDMSGQDMNKKLNAMGIQYKQSGRWFLYQKYKGMELTESATYTPDTKIFTATSMKWTNKGRQFIYEQLKRHGIYPNKQNIHKYEGNGRASI